ncbi:uncharacterized protein HMPREF1120_08872 [Exophiala dermatitidis NIH/UT8656]|uniref:Uncharacterized protein n=1 Tax=Exophiala dermatitidis (strain ATCC 34100 / CBS 525.76 / NIH/UT8656) TaxID=858893 RepID=H6CAY2_EXODN|nr:uncharacterized protein HMPREF1120_08872 [Exophiala dermatitidis NIH/UT8656]EHY60929.1 hypothetical protein HMPREF1120_08872 [Exophiala dermatitidis NIH/UT8656]
MVTGRWMPPRSASVQWATMIPRSLQMIRCCLARPVDEQMAQTLRPDVVKPPEEEWVEDYSLMLEQLRGEGPLQRSTRSLGTQSTKYKCLGENAEELKKPDGVAPRRSVDRP